MRASPCMTRSAASHYLRRNSSAGLARTRSPHGTPQTLDGQQHLERVPQGGGHSGCSPAFGFSEQDLCEWPERPQRAQLPFHLHRRPTEPAVRDAPGKACARRRDTVARPLPSTARRTFQPQLSQVSRRLEAQRNTMCSGFVCEPSAEPIDAAAAMVARESGGVRCGGAEREGHFLQRAKSAAASAGPVSCSEVLNCVHGEESADQAPRSLPRCTARARKADTHARTHARTCAHAGYSSRVGTDSSTNCRRCAPAGTYPPRPVHCTRPAGSSS
jgi:hypothetical protein